MVTVFGKFCRVLRINHDEVLKDMADKLDVSSAFLSAVENKKKEVPINWIDKIGDIYSLDKIQEDELSMAIASSKKEYKMNLEQVSLEDRNLVISFARKLEEISKMSKDEKDMLKKILQ